MFKHFYFTISLFFAATTSFSSPRSIITTHFSEDNKSGGWQLSLEENEEAHGFYDTLQLTPGCNTNVAPAGFVERCWKNLSLSTGFYINSMKMTVTKENGLKRFYYALLMGERAENFADFKKLTFPLRGKFENDADKKLLMEAIPGVENSISFIASRFHMSCRKDFCYFDVRDLNYAGVERGKKYVDQEKVTRGTVFSDVLMPNWTVSILGPSADELYDGMAGDGGKYQSKHIDLSPTVRLDCNRRPNASQKYTACYLGVKDKVSTAFKFPETLELTHENAKTPAFKPGLSFKSKLGVLAVNCESDICKIKVQYLE